MKIDIRYGSGVGFAAGNFARSSVRFKPIGAASTRGAYGTTWLTARNHFRRTSPR
jgi:hypothetical protein